MKYFAMLLFPLTLLPSAAHALTGTDCKQAYRNAVEYQRGYQAGVELIDLEFERLGRNPNRADELFAYAASVAPPLAPSWQPAGMSLCHNLGKAEGLRAQVRTYTGPVRREAWRRGVDGARMFCQGFAPLPPPGTEFSVMGPELLETVYADFRGMTCQAAFERWIELYCPRIRIQHPDVYDQRVTSSCN